MEWRVGVVGFPIEHSLSPTLHAAGLRLAGLRGTSERIPMRESDIAALGSLLGSSFDALSVTMPMKELAVTLCDELDEVSSRIGVVNSLLVRDGSVLGACTDGRGFLDSLSGEFDMTVPGKRVVVLGAGGAARGIVDALVHAGASSITVHARTPSRIADLVARYDNVVLDVDQVDDIDLIVNTTPAHSRVDDEVVAGVSADTIAIDIAYEPRHSAWRALYEGVGCTTGNGLAMLAYQAALQMQWWFQTPLDGATLLEVIR